MRTQRNPLRTLDKLDHKILSILQQDGRIAMKDLAERVGLSVTPCIERVRRMERDGVITGYYARVNPAQLGAALLVFVEITLDHKSGNMFEQFRREVQRIPEVLECHLVSGDFDYLIKARIGEMADYRKLARRHSSATAGSRAVEELRGDGGNQGDADHSGRRLKTACGRGVILYICTVLQDATL